MHVSGQSATISSSVIANMHLIGVRYFLYRYRVQCDPALKMLMLAGFGERFRYFFVSSDEKCVFHTGSLLSVRNVHLTSLKLSRTNLSRFRLLT